jgi:hypothetical protein
MPWTKSEATLADGVQVLSGRPPRMKPETVTAYRWECRCGAETTIYLTNPKDTVRAWCCNAWHQPEPAMLPKVGLLTRLLG